MEWSQHIGNSPVNQILLKKSKIVCKQCSGMRLSISVIMLSAPTAVLLEVFKESSSQVLSYKKERLTLCIDIPLTIICELAEKKCWLSCF